MTECDTKGISIVDQVALIVEHILSLPVCSSWERHIMLYSWGNLLVQSGKKPRKTLVCTHYTCFFPQLSVIILHAVAPNADYHTKFTPPVSVTKLHYLQKQIPKCSSACLNTTNLCVRVCCKS